MAVVVAQSRMGLSYFLFALLSLAVLALLPVIGIRNPVSEQVVLGSIQGITEWLPISSEGMIILAKTHLFAQEADAATLVREAIFLHIGTLAATLIYFRKDIGSLVRASFVTRSPTGETRPMLRFLLVSTLVSGAIGLVLFQALDAAGDRLNVTGKVITVGIGSLLMGTGLALLASKGKGLKEQGDLKNTDGVILGIAQGLSILPGVSRSGITVSSLLLRKFRDVHALRASFLMSVPAVLGANIGLNVRHMDFSAAQGIGLVLAFAFGILTIHLLMDLSRRINFGKFVLLFAILVVISAFI